MTASRSFVFFAVTMVAVGLAAPAFAGDRPQTMSWTGFYVGANAGYGWGSPTGHLSWESAASNTFNAPLADADYTPHTSGALGGLQFGYNYRISAAVLGAEADFQFSDVRGSTTTPSTVLPNAGPDFAHFSASQHLEMFGTIRGRIGFLANDNLLLFGTGGLAYGRIRSETHWQYDTPPFLSYVGTETKTKVGYALGGGGEWAINRSWSVKVEYLYLDFGKIRAASGNVGFYTTFDQKTASNLVRLGLNYHF
jgi:outer membrane immunogenic protein